VNFHGSPQDRALSKLLLTTELLLQGCLPPTLTATYNSDSNYPHIYSYIVFPRFSTLNCFIPFRFWA